MQHDREHASARFRQSARVANEFLALVDAVIHQRVDDVESRDPDRHGGEEQQRRQRDLPGDADVGAERREAIDRAEHEMRRPGEAFAERIRAARSAAIGISFTQSGLSIHAAQSSSKSPAALAHSIVDGESAPLATARGAPFADCARRSHDRGSDLPPLRRFAHRRRRA